MCYELQIHNKHTPLESLARGLPPDRIVLFYPARYDDLVKSLAELGLGGQGDQASPCALPAPLNEKLFIRSDLCGGVPQNLKGRR
jgi:hypothetical protein